jgi:type IV secretion system protein VirB5
MERINTTEDPKAISELQARLQAETAQVANDQNRIAVMRQHAQLEKEQAEQARHEHNLKNLALTDDGLGPR